MSYQPPVTGFGAQECPKCKFSMEPLCNSAVLDRDYGYSLDSSNRWFDPDDNVISSFLFGNLARFFAPLLSRLFGNRVNRRYQKILADYPHSLICTHCEFVLKRR